MSKAQVKGPGLTTLAPSIYDDLKAHPLGVKKLHEADLDAGYGDVYLPEALARKYRNASKKYDGNMFFQPKN